MRTSGCPRLVPNLTVSITVSSRGVQGAHRPQTAARPNEVREHRETTPTLNLLSSEEGPTVLQNPGVPCGVLSSSPRAWVCSVAQSCPLCDPMDCSPPGSSVHGTLQVRILEWAARD